MSLRLLDRVHSGRGSRVGDQQASCAGQAAINLIALSLVQPRGSMAAPESHGVVKGRRDQQREPSN
jgi:hypothetical protein